MVDSKDLLELVFQIVTLCIGIYLFSGHLLKIKKNDSAKIKFFKVEVVDMNLIFYIMLFALGAVLGWAFSYGIYIVTKYFIIDSYYAIILVVICSITSMVLMKTNRFEKFKFLPSLLVGCIAGPLITALCLHYVDKEYLETIYDILMIMLLYTSAIVITGSLSKNKSKKVEVLFSQDVKAVFNLNQELIIIDIDVETEKDIYFLYNSKEYKVGKDNVLLMKQI